MTAQELRLDYLKFYDAENRDAQAALLLRGQFERRFQMIQLRLLEFFGNAVSKNGEPLYDRHADLAWYLGVQPTESVRRVIVENQFGKFDIRIDRGFGLLVPTQKVERGRQFPERLEHYKVYRLVDVQRAPRKAAEVAGPVWPRRSEAASAAVLRSTGGEASRGEDVSHSQ